MFILSNCSFSGCSIAFSGQQAMCLSKSSEEFTEEQVVQETLKDIDIDDIFD